MEDKVSIIEKGCEAIGGGCFWAEFWESFEPLANFLAHDGFRNIMLVVAAIVTLIIAIRRANIADQDKETSRKQADIALKQAATNEAGLNIDRFQKGAAMLGDELLSVKHAGILMLGDLGDNSSSTISRNILIVLSEFVSEATNRQLILKNAKTVLDPNFEEIISNEVQLTMEELGRLNKSNRQLLPKLEFEVMIHNANLRGFLSKSVLEFRYIRLYNCQCEAAGFFHHNFENAYFHGTNFTNANFENSDLSNITVINSIFTGAKLDNTNLKNVDLSNAVGLTYIQLSKAKNVNPELLEKLRLIDEKDVVQPPTNFK